MPRFEFLLDKNWRRRTLRHAFGRSFAGFLGFAALAGAICWLVKGRDGFMSALDGDYALVLNLLPRVGVALAIAALIWVLLPREKISGLVGAQSGVAGLVIATVAGAVTPGGPSSAYALLAMLAASGADRGALIAYITAWATLGLQRVLVWDVPFMGAEFAILRVLVCLPLPVLAGIVARALPLEVRFRNAGREAGE